MIKSCIINARLATSPYQIFNYRPPTIFYIYIFAIYKIIIPLFPIMLILTST